jgi:hypothetical protein
VPLRLAGSVVALVGVADFFTVLLGLGFHANL